MGNYEYILIKKLEKRDKNTKFNIFMKGFFAPIYFLFELFCKIKIWNNFIFKRMVTNDEIFNFLDKQDFEIRGKKFVKLDTLEDSTYDFQDLKQSKNMIFRDYSEALINLFRKNIPFDVENYTNVHVEINDKIVRSYGEIYHSLVYYVWIQYWRETKYIESLKRFLIWLSSVLVCSGIIFALIQIL